MFKFNFSASDKIGSSFSEPLKVQEEPDLHWQPAIEILSSDSERDLVEGGKWLTKSLSYEGFKKHSIKYLSSECNKYNGTSTDVADIEEGSYEGGFKVWECTYDLMKFLCLNNPKERFSGKEVLDLGCGNGFLGILSLYLGAEEAHFQDYNDDVVKNVTIPNVLKNQEECNELSKKCKFFAGDWASFSQLNDFKYDVILTAATIYNTKSYKKLLDVFKEKLKKSGIIILAAKTHYFGWGGGTRQFENFLLNDLTFQTEILWTCSEGVQQEVMEIKFRTENANSTR